MISGPPFSSSYDVMRYWQPRILSSTRGEAPDVEQFWWTSKGPSRDKSGILGWATATIVSHVGEPTSDPETSCSIIRRGVRGPAAKGNPWTPPLVTKHSAASTDPSGLNQMAVWQHPLTVTTARSGTGSAQTRSQETIPGTTGTHPELGSPHRSNRRGHHNRGRVHHRQHRNRRHGVPRWSRDM